MGRRLLIALGLVLVLVAMLVWMTIPSLERVSPSEPADIVTIRDGILKVQAGDADKQNRPLARGTHAKGVCARAEFEVLDVMSTVADRTIAARLAISEP